MDKMEDNYIAEYSVPFGILPGFTFGLKQVYRLYQPTGYGMLNFIFPAQKKILNTDIGFECPPLDRRNTILHLFFVLFWHYQS